MARHEHRLCIVSSTEISLIQDVRHPRRSLAPALLDIDEWRDVVAEGKLLQRVAIHSLQTSWG